MTRVYSVGALEVRSPKIHVLAGLHRFQRFYKSTFHCLGPAAFLGSGCIPSSRPAAEHLQFSLSQICMCHHVSSLTVCELLLWTKWAQTLVLLWCWRRLLRFHLTARRSNQSILKEINPEYSSEGLMLKLKVQYFGHLM